MKIPLIFAALLCCCITYSQNTKQKKIKIIFLGTWHYGNTADKHKKSFDDLFTDRRQEELKQLRNKIAAWHPDKIFAENEPVRQEHWDSVLTDYKNDLAIPGKLMQSEIFQVEIKLAAMLNLKQITCVDYYADKMEDRNYRPADADEAALIAYLHLQDSVTQADTLLVQQANPEFFNLPALSAVIMSDSIIKKKSVLERYRYMNTPDYLQNNNYYNWNFFYSLGQGPHYPGVNYLAIKWMARNMKIYTNILRTADLKKDSCYFVMYGATHIPFLKHLFEQNPYFEVIDIEKVLR